MKLSRNKKIILIGLGFVIMLSIPSLLKHRDLLKDLLTFRMSNTLESADSEPVLAVFSFKHPEDSKLLESCHHYRLKLANSKGLNFNQTDVDKWAKDTIPLIITVETWGANAFMSYKKNPMADLINGKYDEPLKQLFNNLIKKRPHVYLRFNPEIEVPYKRYPWQGYVQEYIVAFEYISNLCRKNVPQVKMVWGSTGYPGVLEYYPGDDIVDVASIILKSDSEMKLNTYPQDYSIKYDLTRRLHRLRFLDKPIFVFGSKNIVSDSINNDLISTTTQYIQNEREIIYSFENFERPKPFKKEATKRDLEIGLYDPQNLLNSVTNITVEHLFADFSNLYDGTFKKNFDNVIARKHDVIVTFEPFRQPNKDVDFNVLQHIIEGKYNEEISSLYNIILCTDRKVYLRFAHEMEIPIKRYPWQSQDPVTYIRSFRYFMLFKKDLPENLKRVWGPAGDRGSIEWYPGNDVVDIMSIAIYGLPDKNITDPNKQESFSVIFKRKCWRLRFIDKPLFITEFGVKGPEDYQTKWLEGAAVVLRENPQVLGVNYFNMSDTPKAWGDIKPPDWSISKSTLQHFINTLNSNEPIRKSQIKI